VPAIGYSCPAQGNVLFHAPPRAIHGPLSGVPDGRHCRRRQRM